MTKTDYYCTKCGSRRIAQNATVHWDVEKQDWELDSVYGEGWCYECGEEKTAVSFQED